MPVPTNAGSRAAADCYELPLEASSVHHHIAISCSVYLLNFFKYALLISKVKKLMHACSCDQRGVACKGASSTYIHLLGSPAHCTDG